MLVQFDFSAQFGEFGLDTVFHLPAFAVDGVFGFVTVEVGAVGEDVEGVALAVGGGEVGVDGVAVHGHVFLNDLLIVGADVHMGQAEAGVPAAEIGAGFAGFLGLGVDGFGGVHGAGADAHDHAGVAGQEPLQADGLEKGVLGGHMAAHEDDEIRPGDQFPGLVPVQVVQELPIGHIDAGAEECARHVAGVEVGHFMVVRGGGHEEGLGLGGQLGADAGKEAVGIAQGGRGMLVDTGGGGQEEDHGGLLSRVLSSEC